MLPKARSFFSAFGLIGILLSTSCRTINRSSVTKSEDFISFSKIPPITCTKGDPSYFLMMKLPEGSTAKLADVLPRYP